jgi:hypothetical protein
VPAPPTQPSCGRLRSRCLVSALRLFPPTTHLLLALWVAPAPSGTATRCSASRQNARGRREAGRSPRSAPPTESAAKDKKNMNDRIARAALTRLFEPGDRIGRTLVGRLGAYAAGASSDCPPPPGAVIWPPGTHRSRSMRRRRRLCLTTPLAFMLSSAHPLQQGDQTQGWLGSFKSGAPVRIPSPICCSFRRNCFPVVRGIHFVGAAPADVSAG